MQVFIFCAKNILTFCINQFCTGVLNAVSFIFLKTSLNIIINFIEWDLTDSDEILETLFLTRCLKLVQISWRLASLLQKHSRKRVGHCVRLSASVCMQSNGRCFRHKNQHDALIQFAYISVDLYGIGSWSIPVNRMEIKPMVFYAANAWTDISEKLKIKFTLVWCRCVKSLQSVFTY